MEIWLNCSGTGLGTGRATIQGHRATTQGHRAAIQGWQRRGAATERSDGSMKTMRRKGTDTNQARLVLEGTSPQVDGERCGVKCRTLLQLTLPYDGARIVAFFVLLFVFDYCRSSVSGYAILAYTRITWEVSPQ